MGTPGLESREFVEQTACMAASPLLSSATQKCQAGAKDKAPIPLFCVSVGLRGQCSRHRWSPACARLGRLDLEPASVRDASCLPCRTALFTWSFYSFFNVLRTSMEPNKQRVHLSFPHWKQNGKSISCKKQWRQEGPIFQCHCGVISSVCILLVSKPQEQGGLKFWTFSYHPPPSQGQMYRHSSGRVILCTSMVIISIITIVWFCP